MKLLIIILAASIASVMVWKDFHWALVLLGAVCGLFFMSVIIYRPSRKTKVEVGTFISTPSAPQGNNVGSEPSPFGNYRSE